MSRSGNENVQNSYIMKRFLLFVFAIVAFAACEQAPIEEQSAIRQDGPETITVGFEGDDTRIQLNEAQKTVWTKDDKVSVFYKSDGNDCYKFTGETGERNGTLKRVSVGEYSRRGDYVIVAYPYNPDYLISLASNTIEATLPAVQEYATDSYGVGSSPMIAMGDYKQFALKNTCGWLKLQLTGDGEVVKSITFKGNDGEQVAGDILIVAEDASVVLADASIDIKDDEVGGALLGDDDIITVVTLDCGEGVALGAEATAFYIALPPQTFEQGFTVEIEDTEGYVMEQSTDKALIIERNTIKPMAALEFISPNRPTPASNQIWYTSFDGNVVEPYKTNVFGANIISNTYSDGKGVITFDGSVTTIGEDAFYKRDSLTSVNIPDSVTTIGKWAFANCTSLTSVNIPDSVTTIGNSAFGGCDSLTSVNIPDSVTSIGNYAFQHCDSLTSVTIGDSVTSIGEWAFANCTSLTSVNIPDSVTTIREYTFLNCGRLTSVTIGDSVTEIEYRAFDDCSSLTSVNIPDSVTTIGEGAFFNCTSLTEFTGKFATEDGRSLIVDNAIIAYANASGTTYTIPDSVTRIGNSAFYNCVSLKSVNIPDSVTTIGSYAFSDCSSLTSVTIPDSVTMIGSYAFSDCGSLISVYCKATTPPVGGSHMFSYNALGRKIYVPMESVEAYKSDEYWSVYSYYIEGYNF